MKARTALIVGLLAVLLGLSALEVFTDTKTGVLSEPMFRNGWTQSDYASLTLE